MSVLPPVEVAVTLGIVCFALSWIRPRRIVALPSTGRRATPLTWIGVVGALAVAAVTALASAVPLLQEDFDTSGFSGWWTRPAPLFAATAVILVAAVALRQEPLPAPGERALGPRRPWHAFAPRRLLWVGAVAAGLTAITSLWQTAIGTTAPADGFFLGRVSAHSELPIYMRFNSGFGYVSGAGWPNTLGTLVVLALAALCLTSVLRGDANRPIAARTTAASVRVERELTARLLAWIMLGGAVATLGAVWMHTGSIGQGLVGFEEEWISEHVSQPHVFIGSGYDAIAYPMNLAGYALQALGFALLLRIATDSARAALHRRRSSGTASPGGEDTLTTVGVTR